MKTDKRLKTFCPLPWNHISSGPEGIGRICCEGFEILKNDQGGQALWKQSKSLYSYFNTKDYKKIRLQMLKGKRPSHCFHCFNQEDHDVKSVRLDFIKQYQSDIKEMIDSTNKDGSVDKPKIAYIDMALGNKCNLKCRMCFPWNSYIIGKDWQKMGRVYDDTGPKNILKIEEALPYIQAIFTTGGEPMLIKEHLEFLEMIVEKGHANHILLRYNSNQTVIPKKIVELWKSFKTVTFNCSVEAYGKLNDYIRYPSKWEHLEKNMYFLDHLSHKYNHIEVYIHTTFQAYNVIRIPELLNYLRYANFTNLCRFPYFIYVKIPEWLSPSLFPRRIRYEITDKILESLNEHEDFFLNYDIDHRSWSRRRMQGLKEFCKMMRNDDTQEKYLGQFIEETKKHDSLRKQSVLDVLPELKEFFS